MRVQPEWNTSPTVRRVLQHWADARPAWLWSQDGETLLWRNEAARFFHGKVRKHGVKLAPEAVPIRGQIARLIRLGSLGRSSLSRIQLLAGERPVSTTCSCTPLEFAPGVPVLLIVGVDPIEPELLERQEFGEVDKATTALFPEGAEFLVISDDSQVVGGSPHALTHYAPLIESEGLPDVSEGDSGRVDLAGESLTLTRLRASPQDAMLLLFETGRSARPESRIDAVRHAEGLDADARDEAVVASSEPEPLLPMGLPDDVQVPPAGGPADDSWVEAVRQDEPPQGTLASLFDQLANDNGLYTTLTAADDTFTGPPPTEPDEVFTAPELVAEAAVVAAEDVVAEFPTVAEPATPEPAAPEAAVPMVAEPPEPLELPEQTTPEEMPPEEAPPQDVQPPEAEAPPQDVQLPDPEAPEAEEAAPAEVAEAAPEAESDAIAAIIDAEAAAAPEEDSVRPVAWRIVGRGFTPIDANAAAEQPVVIAAAPADPDEPGLEWSEDAVVAEPFGDESDAIEPPLADVPDPEMVERVSRYNFDELSRILIDRVSAPPVSEDTVLPTPVNVPAEGALISLAGETFILNRLPLGIMVFRDQHVLFANRALTELTGYESIEALRSAGLAAIFPAVDVVAAGPVTQLLRRNGSLVAVTARLQSINWHGRPALMLSASLAEERIGHEGAVKVFAELSASLSEEGFITLDRAGLITSTSLHARILLGMDESDLAGRAVAGLLNGEAQSELRRFLDLPARFAETERPSVILHLRADLQLILFVEGQAGIVQGYFGFLRRPTRPLRQPEAPVAPSRTDDLEPSMLVRISRGIRRPLNTVIGFADMLGTPAADPGRQAEYARDIAAAGQDIATLVDELDEFARLREGRYPVEATDIELAELLDNCLARVRGQATAARVLVRSAVSESLPRVTADRASLKQAVLNLLASAIDQTPTGGTVILSAQREDDGSVVVNLRDSGEVRTDLGERFVVFREGIGRQGEALRPVRSSVGLALTRSLLAVNTVSLTVDPAAGIGNLFSLLIPAGLVQS